jgi:hypothetical protein
MAFSFQTLIPHLVVANGVLKGDTTAAFRAALTGTLIGGRSPLSLVVTQRLAERDKPPETAATAAVETVAVPDVIGNTEQEAKNKLTDREKGITTAEKITTVTEPQQSVGDVIRQEPVAGTRVPKGSAVKLTIIATAGNRGGGRG